MLNIYRVGDHVRCTNIDKYAYNGREFHPNESDINEVFRIVEIEVYEDKDTQDDVILDAIFFCVSTTYHHQQVVRQFVVHEVTSVEEK